MSSIHSPHLVNNRSAVLSNSSTPTATTPTPSNRFQPISGDSTSNHPTTISASSLSSSSSALVMHLSSSFQPNPPSSSSSSLHSISSSSSASISPNSIQPTSSIDQQQSNMLNSFSSPPFTHRRSLRRMSSPGTQPPSLLPPTLDSSSSLTSKRVHQLGLDPASSHSLLNDVVIGGECGVADGGKASGIQPLSSDNWISHHLTIVLQHSFTVSSPHPIPSHHSDSLPAYCHPPPQNQFLNLTTTLVPDALRNKLSITSLSSFTTSTTTDEDEDEETDEVEEAESQDSTASSCYFPNLNDIDPSCSSTSFNHPCPSTPRSRPTSPPSSQIILQPPIITHPTSSSSRFELLKILNTWSFDANSLSSLQIRSSLHILLSVYLQYTPGFHQQLLDLGVINPQECLRSLVDNLEVAYDSRNAYHNFRHAVDVVQAVYTILAHEGVVPPLGWVLETEFGSDRLAPWHRQPVGRVGLLLDEMSVWALLLAAAGHDVGHPGLSNAFMVNARTPIAYVFSDGAVLENFHRITFTRMLREHGFHKMVDGHIGFRQVLAGAVLATDMGRHFPIVEELKRLAGKWVSSTQNFSSDTTDALADKVLIAAGLIKCGDISNSTRPHQISLTWSSCLLNEWSRQAALEADLQLPVSVVTLDPAEKRAQAKSQIGFTSLFVLPLFTVMEQLSPRAFRPFADNGRLGLKTWQRVVEQIDGKLHFSDIGRVIEPLTYSSELSSSPCINSNSSDPHAEETSPLVSGPLLDDLLFSPLSATPCDEFDSQPPTSSTSFFHPPSDRLHDPTEAHATPKSKAGGWWGGPSFSPSADGLQAADSTFSSISTGSASTIQDSRISSLSKDYTHQNTDSSSQSQPPCNDTPSKTSQSQPPRNNTLSECTVTRATVMSPVDKQLLSPHGSFTVKVSLSHPDLQGSASSSSDEGKANSSNDGSSFSSLGSPSSPPRSPYFTLGVNSASSTSSSQDRSPSRVAVQDSTSDPPSLTNPPALLQPHSHLQSPQRSRDKGMSVDIGLVRRNVARASLPPRKKSYSPHLVNQQVACAKGCGKVTVKCVKCAAESKLKMYRSLSLVKPSLFLRPEHIPGIRSKLDEKFGEHVSEVIPFRNHDHRSLAKYQPNLDMLQHAGTSNSLVGLLKEHSADPTTKRVSSSNQEHNWPPHPFRPLC